MALLIAALVAALLALPPLVYALAVYRKFGPLEVSWYVPYEELFAALRGGRPAEIFAAPLLTLDLTSGLMVASMFSLPLGQLVASLALGALGGANLAVRLSRLRACPLRSVSGMAAMTTSGLATAIVASSTGLAACCGPALSGGVLALLGLSATAAHAVAGGSPVLQGSLLAIFGVDYFRLRRRSEGCAS